MKRQSNRIVAALVTLIALTCAGCQADWPMFLSDASRSAASTDDALNTGNASLLNLKWKFHTNMPIATSTTVIGNTAYVGSWDGYEYAINTTNGAMIWKQFLGQTVDANCPPSPIGITSSATVVNNVLYVGGGDTFWYALDASTGAVLWKVFTGDNSVQGAHYNWSSPLIVGNFAYIGIASNCDAPLVQGQMLKVSLSTHQVVTTLNIVPNGQLGGGIWTTPAYDAGTNTIFVTTGTLNDFEQKYSQAILAIDANSLTIKNSWQLPFDAAVFDSDWGTSPTLTTDANGDMMVSAANKNGILYAFNRNNLAAGPIWQSRIALGGDCPQCGQSDISSGAFANNVLYYASGQDNENGKGSQGSIRAVDTATGKVRWVRQTDGPIYGSVLYDNGLVMEASNDTLEVLDASNGQALYTYAMGGTAFGAVSTSNGQIYVGTTDGNLYAFGLTGAPAAPPADANCPSGFTCQNVGGATGGSESTSGSTLTVNATGAGLGGTSDQFRLISKPVSGDSQTSVRVLSQNGQSLDAGVIVRQPWGTGTRTGTRFYMVVARAGDVEVWTRTGEGANSWQVTTWSPAAKPVSVMVQRRGNIFSAGVSFDGTNYTLIPGSTLSIDLPTTTLQGIVADATSATATGSAAYTGLSAGAITTTMNPVAFAHACPSPWSCTDLGNPSPVGDQTISNGTLSLTGSGAGVDGNSDQAHFVYQSVSGNQAFSALATTQGGNAGSDGVMMRQSTAPTAPMYSVYLTPGGNATIRWRAHDDVANDKQMTLGNVSSPAYLQIVRFSDPTAPAVTYFATETSTDGVNWNIVADSTKAIDMGTGAYLAGVFATSPSTFGSISLGAPASLPPSACPDTWTCQDIGAANAVAGTQVFQNQTWTMDASGSDIWSTFDSFRFAYQPFPENPTNSTNGDGTISARVASQTNVGGDWMKSGVMIRSGNSGGAPYYGVFVTPQHGVTVQWRSTQGGLTNNDVLASVTPPVYLLASRYTDAAHNVVYYSAFTSTDGKTFTLVPNSTVALNLPGPLIAGIAADSYDSKLLSRTVFDHVASLSGSSPPPFLCPAAWTCTDVGGALPPGQDQLTSQGVWNEIGGGGDIWDTSDAFHFVSQSVTGDTTVSAHVTSQQQTDPWAKAGVMLRNTTDPGSPYYAVFVTPANGITVQWRATQGGTTLNDIVAGTVPAYLRVARYTSGTSTYFTAYTSADGTNWTPIGGSTQLLTLGQPLLAGLALTSHDQGVGSAVTFDTVSIAAGAPAPPNVCPAGWTCADIGAPTPAGGQALSSGTWTIQGGGGDIWDVSDSFHFVWNTLAADGTVSAQVASQSNSDPWAKGGLMLRATTDPASPYYAVFVTPGNGITVQWRTAKGAVTSNDVIAGTAPVYLRITRTGTTYSAATSTNGSTWTTIAGSSISIPNLTGSLLRGMAVTSHNTAAISTVVVKSVVTTP